MRSTAGTTFLLMGNIVVTLLVLSGFATLIYEVTWVRLLSLSMGSTSASVSTVLSAFFFGMAVGSYFAERLTRRRPYHLMAYIVLEALIGLCGLLLLPVLLHLDNVMALLPALGTMLAVKFAITISLLAVPTVCMGATFPVMAAILIRRQHDMGLRIGQLYSLNTAGAILGAGCTGFLLIPNLGLDGAVYVACALNFTAVLWGLLVYKRIDLPPADVDKKTAPGNEPMHRRYPASLRHRALIVLFVTGVVAIATEVGWTKYLAVYTGATLYGFSAILTVFLLGIAIGSWAIRKYLARMQYPAVWMVYGLVLLGVSLLLARVSLTYVPLASGFVYDVQASAYLQHAATYGVVCLILFLPTFCLGGVFPLALTLFCANVAHLRHRIGVGYAVNTLGGILGAIGAGFWLIPQYGTDILLTSMAVMILLLPLLFLTALKSRHQQAAVTVVVGLGLAGSRSLPHVDYQALIALAHSRFESDAMARKKPVFLFLKEGQASVISLVTYDGKAAKLLSDGRQDSYIALQDGIALPMAEILLGLMPYFLHPAPKTAFVVGFGGGITVQALTYTPLKTIRVVELEPAVIGAVSSISNGVIPVLQDPRVHLRFNDARNTLLVEQTTYDLVISQPSHPWVAGAGNLFTQRFFDIVSSRLNDHGIFAQWLNFLDLDATTLGALLQAFYGVFPHGFTFVIGTGDLLLFGSKQPIVFDYEAIEQRMQAPEIQKHLVPWKIYDPQGLLWHFALSRNDALTAAGNIRPNSDTRILSEVRRPWRSTSREAARSSFLLLQRHFNLDVRPYLKPSEAAITLYHAGRYSLERNALGRAIKAFKHLNELNPELAQLLARDQRLQPQLRSEDPL